VISCAESEISTHSIMKILPKLSNKSRTSVGYDGLGHSMKINNLGKIVYIIFIHGFMNLKLGE
jgi:hypothetical protein